MHFSFLASDKGQKGEKAITVLKNPENTNLL